MDEKHGRHPFLGGVILAGAILSAASLLLHPPSTNPWATDTGLLQIATSSYWVLDHYLLAMGVTLWLGGLASTEVIFRKHPEIPRNAARLFIASLAVWLVIAAMEIGVLPGIARAVQGSNDTSLLVVARGLFSFSPLAGYFAAFLIWLGISILGWALLRESCPPWLSYWGLYGGIVGIAGAILSIVLPDLSLVITTIASAPPYLWTLIFSWKICRGSVMH
ncbi:MAG: hypothetical protein ACYC2T_07305 [Bacillota bacterium]